MRNMVTNLGIIMNGNEKINSCYNMMNLYTQEFSKGCTAAFKRLCIELHMIIV